MIESGFDIDFIPSPSCDLLIARIDPDKPLGYSDAMVKTINHVFEGADFKLHQIALIHTYLDWNSILKDHNIKFYKDQLDIAMQYPQGQTQIWQVGAITL